MTKRHATKDKGDLATAHVIANLRENQIIPCLPLAEHLPFDLLALMPDMYTLVRLQVKYRKENKHGSVTIAFRSNYYDSKKIYSRPVDFNEIDAYAAVIGKTGYIGYFRVDALPDDARAINLRYKETKNRQQIGIRFVWDYANPLSISDSVDCITPQLRQVTWEDEIAVAKLIHYLQEQTLFPHIPTSQFAPFDIASVSADMQTITRYRVGYDRVYCSPYVDIYALYDSAEDT
ncbi:MAG: group I intron-associated PD-(D/E)XK endonuclease, partial [Chloroflexota bacterium]